MQGVSIYFVGIGGIGMSALAQLYLSQGAHVSGSDRSSSPVTELLEKKGVKVFFTHAKGNVGEGTNLLVYSDAVPFDNPERVFARERGIQERSYFEALGEATKKGQSLVVAGTHGKTSTTAMVAKILIDAGKKPTVIAGSILKEYGSNFVEGRNDLFVIEGCEYRRHFLNLNPTGLIVTNLELDHTDYYHTFEDMQNAFFEIVSKVLKTGSVVTNTTSESIAPILRDALAPCIGYEKTAIPKLLTPGEFNRENARAAKTLVQVCFPDIREKDIDASLASFTGTWRRFEYKGVTPKGALVYDDYAHHPTAVEKMIAMIKEEFPDKHVVVVFHPHLYSRTKSFFGEFAEALALADETILVPIYAAREEPDQSVSSEALAREIGVRGGNGRCIETFDEIENVLLEKDKDVLILTMGAGDVYKVADAIVKT